MTQSKIPFDMEAALKALREGQDLTGKDGILTPLIKQLTEAAMQAELEEHLGQEETPNRKNGKTSKTVKTLSGIANSYTENLLVRAADVTLKEKRKLVLAVRETPLHKGHLRLMTMAADMGAHILPPVPSFYHKPETIEDILDQTIGKIFDYLGISHDLFRRWGDSTISE